MSNMTKVAKNLKKALDDSEKRKPNAYDTEAEVVGAEDNSLWVKFPGGETSTPIRKTMDAKPGDKIMVRVSGHRAWAVGNETSPPTDDTRANAVAIAAQPSIDYVRELVDKDVTVRSISAATGYVDDLYSKNITTENLQATTGYIEDLTSENITAQNIVADHATIEDLDANYAHISNGVIDNAKIGYADVNGLNANYAHISNGVIDNAKIGYADVNNLDAHYAQIDIANVNNAWIENGAIKKAEVFDENVFDLSGDHATLSRIDASKINVANLRADNLVVRRINGQPVVGGYTLIDSNSSGYSSKNPQALGWYEFVNAQWVLSTDTTVDMTKAYYQTGNEVSLYDQAYIDGLEDDLQQQIDGAVETFTGSVVPTLVNWPYTDWYDTSVTPVHDERAKHVGDIYYVVNSASDENGYCYRFAYDNTSHAYSWVLIKDSDVTKALSDISELQTFESETTSWIDETDEGLETIRTNHTTLSGVVDKTVKSTAQLWFTKANTTAPSKPTSHITSTSTSGNAWRTVVPVYNASYPYYYYCYEHLLADGTYIWSDVVRDVAMEESQSTSRTAKSTADANIKSTVQLWFTKANTTAPDAPTAHVTSTSTSGNAWRTVVPSYNASYPYYYYCYEYQKGDNSYAWSAVVRDRAMEESQSVARAALPASTFTSFESTTFKDVKDTVTEQSTTFTNMTSRLGMNSDGTGANTDIVAKESALETTVNGISTRVGKTETKLIGMYATSSTEAGTRDKVATITPAIPSGSTWELTSGTMVTVKFVNANTYAATSSSPLRLNVNGTGLKPITTYSGGALSEAEYKWKAGSTFTFTYNGTNWLMQDSSASVRMNSAETSITQTADSIISLASGSTTYTKPDGTTATSAIGTTVSQTANNVLIKATRDGASLDDQKAGGTSAAGLINVSPDSVKISANHVQITGSAVFNAVDADASAKAAMLNSEIDVGGRNLVLGTETPFTNAAEAISAGSYKATNLYNMVDAYNALGLTVGDYITTSFDISITGAVANTTLKVGTNASPWEYFGIVHTFEAGASSAHIEKTFKVTSALAACTGSKFRFRIDCPTAATALGFTASNVKLERGNKATDWTPAPEDVQAEIDAKKSIHTLVTNLSYTYANILTYSAEGYSKSGGWAVTDASGVKVGDTARLKVTASDMGTGGTAVYVVGTVTAVSGKTVTMTSHGLDTTVIDGGHILTGTIDASRISSTVVNAINANVSDTINGNKINASEIYIGDLSGEIGGRNLLLKTGTPLTATLTNASTDYYLPSSSTWWEESEYGKSKTNNNTTYYLSVSFDWSTTSSTGVAWLQIDGNIVANIKDAGGYGTNKDRINLANGSGHYWAVFKLTATQAGKTTQRMRIRIAGSTTAQTAGSTFTIQNLKFETGEKPTDWTPAPEDLENYADNLQAQARPFVIGTQTAQTGTWTGVCNELTELKEGQEILYFLPYAGSGNATLNLTLGNGTTTGAVNCYYQNTTRLTTHFGAGMTIPLVYHENFNVGGTNYTGWWTLSQYNTNDVDRKCINNAVKVAENITQYCVAGRSGNGHKKLVSGLVIDLAYPICYLAQANISGQTYAVASGGTTTNFYTAISSVNLRNTKDSWTGTQYAMCYIKGTMSGNSFTVHSDIFTTTVPTSDDGFAYIPIGLLYSTYQVNFSCDNSIYGYKNGSFGPLANREASAAQATANAAAPKTSAVAEEQYIYISKASGTDSVSGTKTWVTEAGDKQNTWSTKRPTYNSSYPVLFVAKQKKVVSGTVTCSIPVKDDTTTIIDGGHITTGTIDASKATITNINASNISTGTLAAARIGTGSIAIGKLETATQNKINNALKQSVEYIVGTQTEATNVWTGVTTDASLVTGKTIAYYLPYAGTSTAATLNLTLSGGGTTGAKNVRWNNTNITTHYPQYSIIQMTYDGTYWRTSAYNSDTTQRAKYEVNLVAAAAITNGHIICGTASGYRDIAASVSFSLDYPLLYAGTAIAAGATSGTRNNNFLTYQGITFSNNGTITSGAAGKMIYLKGTVSGRTFTISASPFLTTAVPSSNDGLYYIPLGLMSSATAGCFGSSKDVYGYRNGSFHKIDTVDHYITYINATDGIKIHDKNDTTDYLQINSDAIRMWRNNVKRMDQNDTSLIFYSSDGYQRLLISQPDGIILGRDNNIQSVLTDTSLVFRNSNGSTMAYFGADGITLFNAGTYPSVSLNNTEIRLYQSATNYLKLSSSGVSIYKGSADVATFGTETTIKTTDGTVLARFGYENGAAKSGTAIAPSYTFGIRYGTPGNYSMAEGSDTIASGWCSHAEGYNTEASNSGAHAEGSNTTASALGSHAAGIGTMATAAGQTAVGKYNVLNAYSLFVVGNGTSDIARSTAFEVNPDGSVVSAGYMSMAGGSANVPAVFYSPPASESYGCIIRLWGDGWPNQSHSADTYWLGVGSSGKLYTGTQINGATAITWREK